MGFEYASIFLRILLVWELGIDYVIVLLLSVLCRRAHECPQYR